MKCRDARTVVERLKRYEDRACKICQITFNTPKKSIESLCSMKCVGENNRRLKIGSRTVERETVNCKNPSCDKTIERRVTEITNTLCSKLCKAQFFYLKNDMKSKLVSCKFLTKLEDGSDLVVKSRWEAAFIKDYIEEDDVFVEVKGYEWGPSIEKVKIARKMGFNIIYADSNTLMNVFGLELSSKYLNSLVEKIV
jgi:hypothetical protein